MTSIKINMKQMNKWQVYEDNIAAFDAISKNKGNIVTLNPERYTHWLNEFNIFYTLTE